MSNIGDSMSSTPLPSVGAAGTTYASDLNLFLTEVKARLEADVPRGSLASGDLDLAGDDLQNAASVGLTNLGAVTATARTLQVSGGNLYYVNNSGAAVQLTSGSAINISAINGITGDYGGANPAQFRFVDADAEYYAYDDFAGGAWARLWARNVDIAAGATSSNRVRLAYGGAGSYTMTMPPAAPAAAAALQMATTGAVTASNTFSEPIYAPSFRQSTGRLISIPASTFVLFGGTNGTLTAGKGWTLSTSSATTLVAPLHLLTGERVTQTTWYLTKNSDATNTLSAEIHNVNRSGTSTASDAQTNGTNAPGQITLNNVVTYDQAADNTIVLILGQSDATASAGDYLSHVAVLVTYL